MDAQSAYLLSFMASARHSIRAICRFAKTKAMTLMLVEDQKQNASGSVRQWAAYQVIAADSQIADFLSIEVIARR
jgi:hypothetical protein